MFKPLNGKLLQIQKDLKNKNSDDWMKVREEECLRVFRKMAICVPAYKQFLRESNVDYRKVNNWNDFQKVPYISKDNYLRKYPYETLFNNGSIKQPLIYTATSGSTGSPFYFARSDRLDWQNSVFVELFLRQRLVNREVPILAIVCFGMGIWIGGLINYKSFDMIAKRNKLPLSIITPGISSEEIIKVLKNIAPYYKQVVLAGYPPFVKNITDLAKNENIDLKKLNIRLIFAAEAICEEFRDYIKVHMGIRDIYKDIMNIYGSAELGAMAQETLVSTYIKRRTCRNGMYKKLFINSEKTPTLAQFIPNFVNFEQAENNKLLITGDSTIPLVRYDIGDVGGVLSFNEMKHGLQRVGVELENDLSKNGLIKSICQLPFVYVYERADLSSSFYGLLVYPEWIKPALFSNPLNTCLTGKFTLITKLDKDKNQYLELNLELLPGKKCTKNLEKLALKSILKSMTNRSSEFRELHNQLKKYAEPKLNFWPYGHEMHFISGIKQKWVKRNN